MPVKTVATKFGPMELVAVTEDQIRFMTLQGEAITVNGVDYVGSVYFGKYDGEATFTPQRTVYAEGRYHVGNAASLRRNDNFKDASPAVQRKVLNDLGEVANAFANSDQGRAMLRGGSEDVARRRVESLDREVAEAEADLAAKRIVLARAQRELADLTEVSL